MYHFNQSVSFPGEKGKQSHSFKRGDVCAVPKEVEKHPYFLSLVEAGLVSEADAPEAPKESLLERAKRLHQKLSSKKDDSAEVEEESKKGKDKKKSKE